MNAPLRHVAGPIADESDLVAALRARLEEINVSRAEVDEECELPAGYTSKRLAVPQIKYFGRDAFWNIAEALGLAIVLVEDPAATQRHATRMKRRVKKYARFDNSHWNARTESILRDIASKRGQNANKARNLKLGPRRRKQIARNAALIRWSDVKRVAKGTA